MKIRNLGCLDRHAFRLIGLILVVFLAFLPYATTPAHSEAAAAVSNVRFLTFTDDVGRKVTVRVPVRRTVVFNRYNTEFVRAVGGTNVIVGVDAEVAKEPAYWPHLTTTAAIVGAGQTEMNYEAIIAVKPDVVILPRNGNWEAAAKVLTPFGIPVAVITGWDVLKHEQNVALLGQIYDRPERAEKLNAFYRHYRDLLAERLKGVARKRVYLELPHDYQTAIEGSGHNDMILAAGGINIFGDVDIARLTSAQVNVNVFDVDAEEIPKRRPDLIIKLHADQYKSLDPGESAKILKAIAARPGFGDLPAVKNGQVYHMSYYLAGGCSKIIGALQLAKWLYPERFKDVDPGEAMRVWLEEFQGVPYPGGYWVSLAQIRNRTN